MTESIVAEAISVDADEVSLETAAVTLRSVAWDHPDAVLLRDEMAAEVGPRYARLMRTLPTDPHRVDPETVVRTVVAYGPGPIGHAAVRWNGDDLELKRMFVRPGQRGRGVSEALLAAAEATAREHGVPRLVLQTGHLQPAAVRFYLRRGYRWTPLFSPYEDLPLSNCFAKQLI
ncbi:GNAT family N-acetyltransferase [Nocardia blacklockiae]|uniref:GNAT family N-acetyltransferase n=1 Tax=Nocardia blacklockiae TaxID=480036 RepID=UPI001893B1BD|nr:GNAT family N-acetyltransferase [Nocardia blacklockiae]MBF6174782.1 GNAT family N-acetyltransferase [Nocardia blacklockiae]